VTGREGRSPVTPPAVGTSGATAGPLGEVWVWAERRAADLTDATWEALAEGRELAGGLETSLVLAGVDVATGTDGAGPLPLAGLAGMGVRRVHLAGHPAAGGAEALVGAAAVEAIAAGIGAPAVLLVPGSAAGSDLAARAAIRLDAAHLDDCLSVRAAEDGLHLLRWACDDRLHEEWLVPPDLPLVVTLRPGTRGRSPVTAGGEPPPVQRHPAPAAEPRVRHLGALPGDPGMVPLPEAERIVAAGLGIGARESLEMVTELAGLLGASVAATRPLADRGWVPFERQVGTTGQTVSPRLYVALGISGALQHLSGIIGAETMIAVNTDRTCPMMARATLAVVGDVATVVPLLVARLRERGAAPRGASAPADAGGAG
jgi:electron transfer flavoprotein alpha subunit